MDESKYLEQTISVIRDKIYAEQDKLQQRKMDLVASRRDMYENTAHFSSDFDKLIEMVQHLSPIEVQTYDYAAAEQRLEKYKKLLNSPYFARIDFNETYSDEESIYIGLGNVIDDESYKSYVYDWRAPIASMFYRYELGKASYTAPCGIISGSITLKRQYEIKNSSLQYFFDSNVSIMDDMLKKALSDNASPKMKSIVETIQREQDIIIRDIENDLVIVQGAAGSGKTSVALHRVAFLMYQGLTERLDRKDIVLISPNQLFGKYISDVLPELGEDNISTVTFEDIFKVIFENKLAIKSRNSKLEEIICSENAEQKNLLKSSLDFKLSKAFIEILNRFIKYFEHHMLEFRDVYFNSECIASRHLLKAAFLERQKRYMPVEKRLNQIEAKLISQLQELRKDRLIKLEKFVAEYTDHPFDVKPFARLLSSKQSSALMKTVYKFTRIDFLALYKSLFRDKALFQRLSKGLELPPNISQLIAYTNNSLNNDTLCYEDSIALMYLKIKMSGINTYANIKQVVVDEAQDYYPMHYEILKTLFTSAKYTILGDFNQTIEKKSDLALYDDIKMILKKPRAVTVFLNKSFRCTYEISSFSTQFIESCEEVESFNRHGALPEIIYKSNIDELDNSLIENIMEYHRLNYSSIAIICKSLKQAEELYNRIYNKISVKLVNEDTFDTMLGTFIIPIFMAKGLEFDAVAVYDIPESNKKFMYIACTRALHRLAVFYRSNS